MREVVENPIVREPIPDPHWGVDYFGDEIACGDEVFEFDGYLFLVDNTNRFLNDYLNVKKEIAK